MRAQKVLLLNFAALSFYIACCFSEEVMYTQDIQLGRTAIPIRAVIGGRGALLGLDTGASSLMLDGSFKMLGKGTGRRIKIDSFARDFLAEEIIPPSVFLGKWLSPAREAFVINCAKFARNTGVQWDGYLGMRALEGVSIDINFDARRIRLIKNMDVRSDAALFSRATGAEHLFYLPLTILQRDSVPRVDAPLVDKRVGEISLPVIIDTGCEATLGLRHDVFERLLDAGVVQPSPTNVLGTTGAGSITSKEARFTGGLLMGLPLRGGLVFDAGNNCVLGIDFLMKLNFILDTTTKRFYFTWRNSDPINPYGCLGLTFRYVNGDCYIDRVNPATQTESPPTIQVDDLVSAVGPLRRPNINIFSIYALCEEYLGRSIEVEFSHPGVSRILRKQIVVQSP